ncbi:LPS export ABC transporter ATP-binding protein [Gammaproteobacteria bacterium]|nr:LPS export ABC transporter ATP-binding protein [Gammaproteobacteria bacterium]
MRLSLQDVEKTIGDRKILSNISFSIKNNEIVGLLGPNGAGKTTAFYLAAGLLFPDQGKVLINGQEVTHAPMHMRSKIGLGYLPQEASIFSDLTVKENLMGIAELAIESKEIRTEAVKKLIEEFSLIGLLNLKGRMLSGGQRRKVEIARTLVCNPNILLLDEPFAGIDPIAVEEIKGLLRKIAKRNISILITDHNVRETLSLCDRAIILSEGKIIADGAEDELVQNAHVKEKYFGNMFS